MRPLSVAILIFAMALPALPMVMPMAQAQAAVFDRPIRTLTTTLPRDPLNPEQEARLTCFDFHGFRIKQVDLGEKGAEQLSILPLGADAPACLRENGPGELVLGEDSKGGWAGYFMGAKGRYAFFEGDDGWEGGTAFAVYDSISGQKLIEDATDGKFTAIRVDGASLLIDYQRLYKMPCSPLEASCQARVRDETGLTASSLLSWGCEQAYARDTAKALKVPDGRSASEIRAEYASDPGILSYPARLTMAVGRATISPMPGMTQCHPAE